MPTGELSLNLPRAITNENAECSAGSVFAVSLLLRIDPSLGIHHVRYNNNHSGLLSFRKPKKPKKT